jgi:hypothetical protein
MNIIPVLRNIDLKFWPALLDGDGDGTPALAFEKFLGDVCDAASKVSNQRIKPPLSPLSSFKFTDPLPLPELPVSHRQHISPEPESRAVPLTPFLPLLIAVRKS